MARQWRGRGSAIMHCSKRTSFSQTKSVVNHVRTFFIFLGSFNIPPVVYLHSKDGSCWGTDRAGQHKSRSEHLKLVVVMLLLSCGRSRGRLTNTSRTWPPRRSPFTRSSSPLCLAPSSTPSECCIRRQYHPLKSLPCRGTDSIVCQVRS